MRICRRFMSFLRAGRTHYAQQGVRLVGALALVLGMSGAAVLGATDLLGASAASATPAQHTPPPQAPAKNPSPPAPPSSGPHASSASHTLKSNADLLPTPNFRSFTTVNQTFTVDTNGDDATGTPANCAAGNANTCTLRDAVAAANADTGNTDGINFSVTGVTLANGTIDFTNSVLVDGTGVTVNGGADGSVFGEDDPVSVQIDGLTITNGDASEGGAYDLTSGDLLLDSATITGNVATSAGGGIYSDGDLWVDNSTFTANTADSGGQNSGGGIYLADGAANVENSTFGGSEAGANVSYVGAGIDNEDAALTLESSNFTYNTTPPDSYGEGIGLENDDLTLASGDTFDDNYSTDGGEGVGVENDESLTLSDSHIDGNVALAGDDIYGGGLYDDGYTGDYSDVTVDGTNTSSGGDTIEGGAVYVDTEEETEQFTWQGGTIDGTNNGTDSSSDDIDGGAFYLYGDGEVGNVSISGVTISGTDNNATPLGEVVGGAVYADDNTTLTGVSISNTTSSGSYVEAGVLYVGAPTSISSSTISSTSNHGSEDSSPYGGGIEGGVVYADFDGADGQVTIDNDSITGTTNTADLAAASTPSSEISYIYGGVLDSAESDLNVSSTPITATTDTASGGDGQVYGGEFYLDETFATMSNVNMTGATVTADDYIAGGLWYNYDDTQSDLKNVTLGSASVSTLGGPDASDSGDIDGSIVYDTDGNANMNVVNGTFDDVTSSVPATADYVWGIETAAGDSQFTNTTIANDSLTPTGDTALVGIDGGDLSLLNTIVASTTPAQNCVVESGAIISAGHNLDNGSSCNFTQPGDISNANPLVQSLANNGGQVSTGALANGSPAIDAGTNHGCPNTDARGVPRPQGSTCDIGSYEYVHQGYWMDASDGGIFSFGNAQFYGSMGGKHLNKPVVGMAATLRRAAGTGKSRPTVASSTSGDAGFGGSMGGKPLNAPMVGMAGDTGRRRVLDGGIRRWHLHLRGRQLLRLHGWQAPERADRRHGGHARRRRLLAGGLRRRDLLLRRRHLLRLDRFAST